MVRMLTLVLAFLTMAVPSAAQVFDTASARQMLYPTRGHTIQTAKELSPQNRRIVTGIVPLMAKEMRQPVRYYTAIAWSPKDGMVHEFAPGGDESPLGRGSGRRRRRGLQREEVERGADLRRRGAGGT